MFERDIQTFTSFASDLFSQKCKENTIHICCSDYELCATSSRESILNTLCVAEGIGALKSILYSYDPFYIECKCRDAMKYLQLDIRSRSQSQTILEFGRTLWSKHFPQQQYTSYAIGDLEEATSYLFARYLYTKTMTELFFQMCSVSGSLPSDFYTNLVKTYISSCWVNVVMLHTTLLILLIDMM